jgi:hypothetical protein
MTEIKCAMCEEPATWIRHTQFAGICMIEYDTGLEPAPQAPQIARQIKQHFGVTDEQ